MEDLKFEDIIGTLGDQKPHKANQYGFRINKEIKKCWINANDTVQCKSLNLFANRKVMFLFLLIYQIYTISKQFQLTFKKLVLLLTIKL